MRWLGALLAVALGSGLLLVATASSQPASSPSANAAGFSLPKRECADVGPPQTDVGLYKVITRKLACGRARAILRDWYHDPSQKDSGPAGWLCAVVQRGRYEIRSYCHRSGRSISFSRYSA